MKVQTFVGKVSVESLRHLDHQINRWLQETEAEPKHIVQTFGYEPHRETSANEPVVITSVWY